MKKAYIVLEDGQVFEGQRFGADGEVLGELVFTTGMGGYIETLTDPSFYSQIVMHTFPLIGNYGIIEQDFESDGTALSAYVVREGCEAPSNFRCQKTLDQYLKEQNVVGVYGVDTRQITKIIRESGVMNARIVDEVNEKTFEGIKEFKAKDVVKAVSCKEVKVFEPQGEAKYNVVLIDYGSKRNIIKEFTSRNCKVTAVPYNTSAKDILALKPDGIMLSNGPGDPSVNVEQIEQIKLLLGKAPIFGICLGHQLMALANGAKTVKLKYGHRGANQPVKQLSTGRTYISSQNHGYAVVAESLSSTGAVQSFVNANDGTCEGMDYPHLNSFTVQFHPEACSGPKDTGFLFDNFIEKMGGKNNAAE